MNYFEFNRMSMKKGIIISALVLFFAGKGVAQQIPMFSQYIYNPYMLNPSMAGQLKEAPNLFLAHRSQWAGISGAPTTSFLSLDAPIITDKVGIGFNFFNDVTDIMRRFGGYASYSYSYDIDENNRLVPGVSVGIVDNQIDFGKSVVRDTDDPILFTESQRKASFDGAFGMSYFYRDKVEAGIAVPQLLSNKFNFEDNNTSATFRLQQHLLFHAKYNYQVSDDYSIHPLLALRYTKNTPLQYDVNVIGIYKDIFRLGLSYRSNYAIGASTIITIHKSLSIGMSYDFITSPLREFSGSNAEVMINYSFSDKSKVENEQSMMSLESAGELHQRLRENKKTIEENKVEIDRLNGELESFKMIKSRIKSKLDESINVSSVKRNRKNINNSSLHRIIDDNLNSSKENSEIRIGQEGDFIDELGVHRKGLFLIVGSYNVKINAIKAKHRCDDEGYTGTKMLYNKVKDIYNVYISQPENTELAVELLEKAKSRYPDAWILILE